MYHIFYTHSKRFCPEARRIPTLLVVFCCARLWSRARARERPAGTEEISAISLKRQHLLFSLPCSSVRPGLWDTCAREAVKPRPGWRNAAFVSGRRRESDGGPDSGNTVASVTLDLWAAPWTQTAAALMFDKAAETRQACSPPAPPRWSFPPFTGLFDLL